MIKLIKPEEVQGARATIIPDFIFQAFNEMIVENWSGGQSIFTQDAVIEKICNIAGKENAYTIELFSKKYLDVEPYFRDIGWEVIYDKPGYNESYDANFRFSKKD